MDRCVRSVLIVVVLFWAGSSIGAGDPLGRHLAYIHHLKVAEKLLDGGKPSHAIVELGKALDLKVPQSYFGQFRLQGTGATAHYLMACAYSLMGRGTDSVRALENAASNGFSDLGRALEDPCLETVHQEPRFKTLASRAPLAARKDSFSGKTVSSEAFGKAMILHRKNNFPKLGELAPEILLERSDGSGPWALSSLRGYKPVVLVFGSFT